MQIVPIIAIDFSIEKNSECLTAINSIAANFRNIMNLSMYGFGAITSTYAKESSPMFPLSRHLRNPFTPNDKDAIQDYFHDCKTTIELGQNPIVMSTILTFVK